MHSLSLPHDWSRFEETLVLADHGDANGYDKMNSRDLCLRLEQAAGRGFPSGVVQYGRLRFRRPVDYSRRSTHRWQHCRRRHPSWAIRVGRDQSSNEEVVDHGPVLYDSVRAKETPNKSACSVPPPNWGRNRDAATSADRALRARALLRKQVRVLRLCIVRGARGGYPALCGCRCPGDNTPRRGNGASESGYDFPGRGHALASGRVPGNTHPGCAV